MTSPKLTPSVVTNDARLGAAIDEMIHSDDEDRAHRETIAKLQADLRRQVTDEAWQLYLGLDAAVGARIADLSVTITAWAFVEGQLDAGKGGGR